MTTVHNTITNRFKKLEQRDFAFISLAGNPAASPSQPSAGQVIIPFTAMLPPRTDLQPPRLCWS